jgi:outer membrane receptor for ferrienterochelin and colicins
MKHLNRSTLATAISAILFFSCQANAEEDDNLFDNLSLEDLFNIEITSASNVKEKLSDAPAVVMVYTRDEIQRRGYSDLVELFDDLPGIDTSITYGDLYFRPYWRGFRKGSSSTFLFMIDGMVMNHLWFNWTDVMVSVPLSFIDQVEVVYGPASSVYGPNALMGVINVITSKGEDSNDYDMKLSAGSFDTKVIDMTYHYKKDGFGLRLTGFMNQGDLDKDSLKTYTWTDPDLLTNRQLWGGFLDNPTVAGNVTSPRKNKAVSANVYYEGFEAGAQYYYVGDMYGTNYAFDRMQIQALWVETDLNLYLKNRHELSENLTADTLVRYRESNVPNESNSVEGYPSADGSRVVTFGYWQSLSNSWSVEQSFDISFSNKLSLKTGLKYELKDLQKAYDLPYGPNTAPEDVDAATYDYPEPPVESTQINNRAIWQDNGIYVQGKYDLSELFDNDANHFLNLGFRRDKNSFYGSNQTIRAGYVGHFGHITTKVLYGEAIQEPTPRQLYGGWGGSGSSPILAPETSKTLEAYIGYTKGNYSLSVNPYYNKIDDTILNLTSGPVNIGLRNILGVEVQAQALIDVSDVTQLKVWAFYSYLDTDEEKYDVNGIKTGDGPIGDLADHKLHFGVSGDFFDNQLSTTIRGRYIGEKDTVETNPVRSIDSFFTMDATFVYKNFGVKGLSFSLKVNNIFDQQYFHPGIRDASSGNTAGYFNEEGVWQASAGWSNSVLPQPGRSMTFSLNIQY